MLYQIHFVGVPRGNARTTDSSSHSSTISSEYIVNLIEGFKTKQNKPSTSINYHTIWKNFNKFLIKLDNKPDSWEERVAFYGGYLVHQGVQSSTLKSYVSAIKKTLVLDGYDWNDDQLKLSLLTNACKNTNDKAHIRLPIQNGLLELLLFELQRKFKEDNQPYLESLYKTLFLLAYYGLFRIGELATGNHPILARDVFSSYNKLKQNKIHFKDIENA